MLRTRPRLASLTGIITAALAGCAPDIGTLETTPSPSSVVVAQFDPTNPIPQLQLIPSPTALAQNPDGTIDKEAVAPETCELPTTAQCLQFVDGGWPTTLFPTLFFSAPLVVDTLDAGLKLFAVTETGLSEVPIRIEQTPRPSPPEACLTDAENNGTMPPTTYDAAAINASWGPTPVDVRLIRTSSTSTATIPLDPATQYIVVATRDLRGEPSEGGGARPVEPSALFYLLNSDDPPVTQDGTILNPLLRSQVQSSVLAALFPGRSFDDLSPAEQAQVQGAVAASGVSLFGLYQFVNQTVGALVASGQLSDRSDAVIVNTWTTGAPVRAPTEVVFDPAGTTFPTDIRFPLPNDQLLTVPSSSVAGGLQVAFPTEGLSATLAGVVGGLNTLNGFGLTTPIVMQTSREIDQASLAGNVVMLELDAMGAPTGTSPAFVAVATPAAEDAAPGIAIQPLLPLQPNTQYVIGVGNGVLDTDGQPITSAQIFDFLKSPTPLIEDGEVAPSLEPALQCSTLATTGMLAPDEQVVATATALEVGLARPRWQSAFQALEGATPPIPRTELAMAFTYKTQSITDTLDLMKSALPQYELLPPMQGRLQPTNVDIVDDGQNNAIAATIGITDRFCLPACQAGALEPAIPRDQCAANRPAVEASPVCSLFRGAFASAIGRAQLFLMRTYRATAGNPFAGGTFTPATVQMPRVEYVPIWIITPRGEAPAGGWPVAIFQHGLGGQKENALLIANTLAQAGWAVAAMDMPFHGQRASDILNNAGGFPCVDMNGTPSVDPADVTCDLQSGVCTGGCDGTRDPSGTGFLNPNIFAIRDNYRQATFDQLALLRTLQQESMGMGLLGNLDGGRIGYIGQSLGGIQGGNLAAYVTPAEMDAMVLNVAGGNLVDILQGTVPTIAGPLYAGLAQAGVCTLIDPSMPSAGCEDTPLFQTFLLLAQWVTEPGDPIGNSVGVVQQLPMRPTPLGANKLLMQISVPDPVIPNETSQTLAATYGFDLMQGDERFQPYDFSMLPNAQVGSGCHGFLLAPSCGACVQDTLCNTLGAQQQAAAFVNSAGATIADQTPAELFPGTPFAIDCANPCN